MANFNKNTNVYDSRYNKVKGKRNEEASKMKRTGSENLADREKTITAKYSRDVAAVQDFVDTFVALFNNKLWFTLSCFLSPIYLIK